MVQPTSRNNEEFTDIIKGKHEKKKKKKSHIEGAGGRYGSTKHYSTGQLDPQNSYTPIHRPQQQAMG